MAKILIVEDDQSIRNLISMTLIVENHITEEVDNGEDAYEMIEKDTYDLILLDIMLPKMNGYELLQKIKHKNIPVIFLTAKISLQDKILGLKLGADDYIIKPFEPLELLARVEAVIRRSLKYTTTTKEVDINHLLKYKDIVVNTKERSVKKNNLEIILTRKEFDLLKLFIENQNIVFTREQLLDKIWGYDYYGGTRTVDMHIKQLRQKLGLKDCLDTVFKVGYKLRSSLELS